MSRAATLCRAFALAGEIDGCEHRFPLKEGLNRIGSLPSNQVTVTAAGVSKRHANLIVRDGRVSLEDLASKNGTWVNGERIATAPVRVGDEVRFGSTQLCLESIREPEGELAMDLRGSGRHGRGRTGHRGDGARDRGNRETSTVVATSGSEPAPGGERDLVFPGGHVRGNSPQMTALYRQIRSLARSDLPVLILGETGVGKEGIACILQASSERRDWPLVAISCAAIPAELLEAELFGIGKGVATGVDERPGKFLAAQGGTLLLDEIGDMPLALQAKLLRALQQKEIQPVGGKPIPVDVRIIAATNSGLEEMMEANRFRRDLYYRLAGFVLRVPPLRQRRQDIPALVEHFLRTFSKEAGKSIRGVTALALARLVERSWPGNVRELEHEVRRLAFLCPDHQAIDSLLLEPSGQDQESTAPGMLELDGVETLELAAIEQQVVREALRRTRGNRTQAARLLGISREALHRRLRRFGLTRFFG